MVLVEGAGILGDRVEGQSERGPRLPVDRMGVGGSHHLGPGSMDLGMDVERGHVDRLVSLHHVSQMVDQDEVGHPDQAEVGAERIDPEVVETLGITSGDVAGHTLVEPEFGEQAQPGGQALLTEQALPAGGVELHARWECDDLGHDTLLGRTTRAGRRRFAPVSLGPRDHPARCGLEGTAGHRPGGPSRCMSARERSTSSSPWDAHHHE